MQAVEFFSHRLVEARTVEEYNARLTEFKTGFPPDVVEKMGRFHDLRLRWAKYAYTDITLGRTTTSSAGE